MQGIPTIKVSYFNYPKSSHLIADANFSLCNIFYSCVDTSIQECWQLNLSLTLIKISFEHLNFKLVLILQLKLQLILHIYFKTQLKTFLFSKKKLVY